MKLRFAAAAVAALIVGAPSMAATCIGTCSTATGPDGVVTSPPAYGPGYSYVSTVSGVVGAGRITGVANSANATGSEFSTSAFTANAGDSLNFYFNYITSDGGGTFTDYSFAELLSDAGTHVAWLFTARTTPTGNTSPGFGLPANDSTLNPAATPIIGGAPTFSGLGTDSGNCFLAGGAGCGYTGWINSDYTISATGSYVLRFGVTNTSDNFYQSALAYAGVTVAGVEVPTGEVPEPATWAMFIGGFGLVGSAMRRRKVAVSFA